MSAPDIVERAAALNVRLWVEGERINLEGPTRGVATIKPEIVANKPEILAYLKGVKHGDCAGAMIERDGGAYLPWGPHVSAGDVRRLRAGLADMIAELAALEGWPRLYLDEVMMLATCGPLSALLPDVRYFGERLAVARDEAAARAALAARTWKYGSKVR